MKKNQTKVVNIIKYKEKKKQKEIDRDELLNLIKQIMALK